MGSVLGVGLLFIIICTGPARNNPLRTLMFERGSECSVGRGTSGSGPHHDASATRLDLCYRKDHGLSEAIDHRPAGEG